MDTPPTIAEELDRKAVEHLGLISQRMTAKQCSLGEAQGALQAIWAITSGLVPRATMDATAEFASMVDKGFRARPPVQQLAVLQMAGALVVVVRDLVVTLVAGSGVKPNDFAAQNTLTPHQDAITYFNAVVERLKGAGWAPLDI